MNLKGGLFVVQTIHPAPVQSMHAAAGQELVSKYAFFDLDVQCVMSLLGRKAHCQQRSTSQTGQLWRYSNPSRTAMVASSAMLTNISGCPCADLGVLVLIWVSLC
jgi:hypothetical protein